MKSFLYSQKLQRRAYCASCRGERAISRRAPDHRTHLFMTFVTAGLWSPVWLWACWAQRYLLWRCRTCRHAITISPAPAPAPGADVPTNSATSGRESAAAREGISPRLSPRVPRRFREETV